MAPRPTFIDLRSHTAGQLSNSSNGLSSPRSLPSPRLHVAGEIPPELSPLDAFAAQSRLLARQLNGGANGGKRMSRLPPLAIAESLAQNRPGYFRSASEEGFEGSYEAQDSPAVSPGGHGQPTPPIEAPLFRPTSVHPQIGEIPPEPSPKFDSPKFEPIQEVQNENENKYRGRGPPPGRVEQLGMYGARRDLSPVPMDQGRRSPRPGPGPRTGRSPSDAPYRERMAPQPARSPSDGNYRGRGPRPPHHPSAPHQGRMRPENSPSAPHHQGQPMSNHRPSGDNRRPPNPNQQLPGRFPSAPHHPNSNHRPERSPSAPHQGRISPRPDRTGSPLRGSNSPRLDRSGSPLRGPSPRPARSPSDAPSRPSNESLRQRAVKAPGGSLAAGGYVQAALAPPRLPFAQKAPSTRSMSMDSSDDELSVGTNSPQRKLSSTSALSTSPSGMSSPAFPPTMARSPSASSDYSVGSVHGLPRPAFNFSRPISRSSNHPAEGIPSAPSRQASSDSQPSFILTDDTAQTPVSMQGDAFPDNNLNEPAPSYVYSTFSLPRGKILQRNSAIFQENQPQAQFLWEQPVPFSNAEAIHGGAPPSPPSRPSTSSRPELLPPRPSYDRSLTPNASLAERGRSFTDPSNVPIPPSPFDGPPSLHKDGAPNPNDHAPSVASSNSTIKAGNKSQHSLAPSADLSGEEHVSKAIEYHESGSLTKSTYHLRLAARQHHPTGMLLYALACRHGWGMRPNQKEGVAWLRKAADSASLEVADDEDGVKDGKNVDVVERKTRKAQFALSIYELGVSHMNGWGIEQDKVLALRCFEIAGSWGDGDALAEAGFCYAQGVGCKKDLMKSAKFYRAAEAKGISMIGNSWIYKAKYNDGDSLKGSGNGGIGDSPGRKNKKHLFGRTGK